MNYNRTKQADKIARRTFRKYHGKYPENLTEKEKEMFILPIEGVLGVYRKTRTFCSNPSCCGNPRKLGELTIQERKAPDVNEEWYD